MSEAGSLVAEKKKGSFVLRLFLPRGFRKEDVLTEIGTVIFSFLSISSFICIFDKINSLIERGLFP